MKRILVALFVFHFVKKCSSWITLFTQMWHYQLSETENKLIWKLAPKSFRAFAEYLMGVNDWFA
jgi:hypothetical protein